MDELGDRSEGSLQETTEHLNEGLKACGKVVASYRAMLGSEAESDTSESKLPHAKERELSLSPPGRCRKAAL